MVQQCLAARGQALDLVVPDVSVHLGQGNKPVMLCVQLALDRGPRLLCNLGTGRIGEAGRMLQQQFHAIGLRVNDGIGQLAVLRQAQALQLIVRQQLGTVPTLRIEQVAQAGRR